MGCNTRDPEKLRNGQVAVAADRIVPPSGCGGARNRPVDAIAARIVRQLLGLQQTRISGEVLCLGQDCELENLQLRLRVFTGERMEIATAGPVGQTGMAEYFANSALAVLDILDP